MDTFRNTANFQMEWVSEKNRNKIPYQTDKDGNYDDRSDSSKQWRIDDGLNWWTNGFWAGILWLLYQDTPPIYCNIFMVHVICNRFQTSQNANLPF